MTCHTPLTPETRHIVNGERLALMKPTAVLINTSRGPVVHEVALIEALQEGRIAGAGLDVFEQEPVDADNPSADDGQRSGDTAYGRHDLGHLVPPRLFRIREYAASVEWGAPLSTVQEY